MTAQKALPTWFPYAFWASALCLVVLSGAAAWLQQSVTGHQTPTTTQTSSYAPLPAEPADTSQIFEELQHVDMLAIALLDDAKLNEWLGRVGPRLVLREMYADRNLSQGSNCHQAAHLIGHNAFTLFGPDAFAAGSEVCQAGYYHGVTERLIDTLGIENIQQRLTDLCGTVDTPFAKFQCYHGAGHGVMGHVEYDLPKALEICGTIPTQQYAKNCYGGVFMENIVAKLDPEKASAHQTVWLSQDPHFPCNAVNQNADVQESCYSMQTTWLNTLVDYDQARVGQLCTQAPAAYVATCMQSIGRESIGKHNYEAKGMVGDCTRAAGPAHFDDCIAGGLKVIMDFYGTKLDQEAIGVCTLLPTGHQARCFRTLYDYSERHFPGRAAQQQCQYFPKAYQNFCT